MDSSRERERERERERKRERYLDSMGQRPPDFKDEKGGEGRSRRMEKKRKEQEQTLKVKCVVVS